MVVNIDHDLNNADWPKRTWDLPPYKSTEFPIQSEMELEVFRTLPVYKAAVERGWIVNDEWRGPINPMDLPSDWVWREDL